MYSWPSLGLALILDITSNRYFVQVDILRKSSNKYKLTDCLSLFLPTRLLSSVRQRVEMSYYDEKTIEESSQLLENKYNDY